MRGLGHVFLFRDIGGPKKPPRGRKAPASGFMDTTRPHENTINLRNEKADNPSLVWDRLPARLLCTRFFRCPLDGGRRWYAAVSPDLPIQEGFCKAFIAATGRFVQPVYARRAAAAVLAVKAFLHVVSLLCGSPPYSRAGGRFGRPVGEVQFYPAGL